jgi:hypothetical protein
MCNMMAPTRVVTTPHAGQLYCSLVAFLAKLAAIFCLTAACAASSMGLSCLCLRFDFVDAITSSTVFSA